MLNGQKFLLNWIPGRVDGPVVEGGVGGAVAERVDGDGSARVSVLGGVRVADAHLEGLGEAAPVEVKMGTLNFQRRVIRGDDLILGSRWSLISQMVRKSTLALAHLIKQ